MTAKQFLFIGVFVVATLAAIISSFIARDNFTVPIISTLTALIVLVLLKKRVKEVMEDERDYEVAGKAARYAIMTFSSLAAIVIMVLFAVGSGSDAYTLAASVLAYSVCALMLIYSMLFKYFQKYQFFPKKGWYFLSVALVLAVLVIFGLRLFSGEDTWICSGGIWIKHGVPAAPMPYEPCK